MLRSITYFLLLLLITGAVFGQMTRPPTDRPSYGGKLLPLEITTDAGTKRMMVDKKGITVTSTTMPFIDTRDFYLKKVIYDL